MKKILFLLLFFYSSFTSSASQWYVGVPVNDSILYGTMNGYNNCFPLSENNLIYPVSNVTGVKYTMIIRYLSLSNSIYTSQTGVLHVGDSLFFTSTYPIYDFYYPAGGSFNFVIRAVGTPQTAGQTYPCGSFFEVCTTSTCQYTCQYIFSNQCTVQILSSVHEKEIAGQFSVYPNPSSFSFTINSTERINSIVIYDILGNLVQKENENDLQVITINLFAPKGTYFVKVINENLGLSVKKIIVE